MDIRIIVTDAPICFGNVSPWRPSPNRDPIICNRNGLPRPRRPLWLPHKYHPLHFFNYAIPYLTFAIMKFLTSLLRLWKSLQHFCNYANSYTTFANANYTISYITFATMHILIPLVQLCKSLYDFYNFANPRTTFTSILFSQGRNRVIFCKPGRGRGRN